MSEVPSSNWESLTIVVGELPVRVEHLANPSGKYQLAKGPFLWETELKYASVSPVWSVSGKTGLAAYLDFQKLQFCIGDSDEKLREAFTPSSMDSSPIAPQEPALKDHLQAAVQLSVLRAQFTDVNLAQKYKAKATIETFPHSETGDLFTFAYSVIDTGLGQKAAMFQMRNTPNGTLLLDFVPNPNRPFRSDTKLIERVNLFLPILDECLKYVSELVRLGINDLHSSN